MAPTPSGHLHLGNIVAFGAAWLSVRTSDGRLLYRNEDVDRERARPDIAESQRSDLRWLGIDWDAETPAQSERDYQPWLERVADRYFCQCTRREIREAGQHPRDCASAGHTDGAVRFRVPPGPVSFVDRCWGPQTIDPSQQDDPVLRRRDGVFAYNLAVTADDIADGVTEVVRGADLLDQSAIQIRLWQALGAEPPTWLHTPLIVGPDGKKLSKSHRSTEVRALRASGALPSDIWRVVLPWLGIEADHIHEVGQWAPDSGPRGPIQVSEGFLG